jgi:hypothetical protein
MSGAFTPGPWDLVAEKGFAKPSWVIEARPPAEQSIALIMSTEANARLISATPDGHTLLIEMAAVLKAGGDFQRGPKGRHHDLLARLDAYFAKAEGRS